MMFMKSPNPLTTDVVEIFVLKAGDIPALPVLVNI